MQYNIQTDPTNLNSDPYDLNSDQIDQITKKIQYENVLNQMTKNIQYLNTVQVDPVDFNCDQIANRIEYENLNGRHKLNQIMWSDSHNDLKSTKSIDYRLNPKELDQLNDTGIVMKNVKTKNNKYSFGLALKNLHDHDIPVMITSDMMLYALHRFYDKSLEIAEVKLIQEFKDLCESMLKTIHSLPTTNQKLTQNLKGIEMYLMVPYVIFNSKYAGCMTPKFNTSNEITNIVSLIKSFEDIDITINGVNFKFNGTTFKPRGHYTNSEELTEYFLAFTWFSKATVKLNKLTQSKQEYIDSITFAVLLSQIAKQSTEQINKVEKFVTTLIGEPDGYTLTSFAEEFECYFMSQTRLTMHKSLTQFLTWFLPPDDDFELTEIAEKMVLTKQCKLTKFGDSGPALDKQFLTEFCFSLIGKGMSFDNHVINAMVDVEFKSNTGFNRKYPSIYDVGYAVFGNSASLKLAQNKMKDSNMDYAEYLTKVKSDINIKINENTSGNTLYGQELQMLKALSNYPAVHPFNTNGWQLKQLQTQIGHYSELRHDNVLYAEECCGFGQECSHPDILIEPCLEFWQELKKTIQLMKGVFCSNKASMSWESKKTKAILDNFDKMVDKFIKYLGYFLDNKEVPPRLKEELKSIIDEHRGSGSPYYTGWYCKLFYNDTNALVPTYEASSYFTAVPDDRDDGGICHLGNGDVQLVYIVCNKILYVGPVYTVYDIVTPYTKRYNDDEWKAEYKQYQALDFNTK